MKTTQWDAVQAARRAVKGDSQAFAELADGVKMSLYTAAWAKMSNEADALEAVDETIYKAYRSIRRLREPQYFKTWITRILINTCNSMLTKRRRETLAADLREEVCRDDLDGIALKDAVKMLPGELQDVIALRFLSDMTVRDTARVLDLAEGTVKTRQRRALTLLKVELKEDNE